MWAIPVTALIIVVGIIILQILGMRDDRLCEQEKFLINEQNKFLLARETIEKKIAEFDAYKVKLDALNLRAGFKL